MNKDLGGGGGGGQLQKYITCVRTEINIVISGATKFYGHIQVCAMRDWVKKKKKKKISIFISFIPWQEQVMSPATLWLLVTHLAGTALSQSKFIQRCT